MPVALIVFGEKSHKDLHGALSLTPIIYKWPCSINWHVTTPHSGDLLFTFPIYQMEKKQLTEFQWGIKFRMSTHVFYVFFNHFVEYLRLEDLTLLFLVRKCILKYGFINSLGIPRAITNGWASILVTERGSNNPIAIVNVLLSNWAIQIWPVNILPWMISMKIRDTNTMMRMEENIFLSPCQGMT